MIGNITVQLDFYEIYRQVRFEADFILLNQDLFVVSLWYH